MDRYISFYLETLGVDFLQGTQTGEVPNVYSPIGGTTVIDGAFFGMRGDTRVFFDWLEWRESREFPTPYQEPNHLGIIRCALEVDDLEAAYRTLKRSKWAKKRRIVLGAPESGISGDSSDAHGPELHGPRGRRLPTPPAAGLPTRHAAPLGPRLVPDHERRRGPKK